MKKTILSLAMMALLSSCETEEERKSKIFIAECEYITMKNEQMIDNIHLMELQSDLRKVLKYGSPAYDSTFAFEKQLRMMNDSFQLECDSLRLELKKY